MIGRGGGGGGGGHGGGIMTSGGGRGGGMFPGGFHRVGGFRPAFRQGPFFSRNFFWNGFWWGWGPTGWVIINQPWCSRWSTPLVNAPSALVADAASQLAANADSPVSAQGTDGTLYLFTREAGQVVIRYCVST